MYVSALQAQGRACSRAGAVSYFGCECGDGRATDDDDDAQIEMSREADLFKRGPERTQTMEARGIENPIAGHRAQTDAAGAAGT